ncbi:RAMP superfamily CRISPR-associated protein [Thermopolyspora sp. NPDC052614]|uniref:RAMP superfamily CRISPR-associated protein n=1 Tax=Thermopolyspora sp. NPDC052614 TaxID=3155682 RepID=UPI00343866E5
MNLDLTLFMISDWQVGTGTGAPGYLDRLVQRDPRGDGTTPGPPIVPAKTLVGVWRDSCELAAYALDAGPIGVWHEWVDFLFGGQYKAEQHALRPAALIVDGALRPPGRLTDLLLTRPQVALAATFRKPGVAIDPVTGTAKAEMLRFEELARAGVTLTGKARIEGFEDLDGRQRRAVVTILGAGARLLETIGGKRRRGAGRCLLTVTGDGFPDEVTLPQHGEIASPPAGRPYTVEDRPEPAPGGTSQGWECAELTITVEQPVLVAATVEGNLVSGADHIPGWCLMPEVARRLGGPAHALVRTGDLVVTAATPLSPAGEPTLPVPRVLKHAKGNPSKVIGSRMRGPVEGGKPYRDGYVTLDGRWVSKPTFTVRMHNTISDAEQRPLRRIGGVYIYRALACGTRLRAEVRVRAGALGPAWERKLSGPEHWRVGRSAKDDYGKVKVEARRIEAPPSRAEARRVLRVWLLSDLLVRDERLRLSTRPEDVARALQSALARAGAPGVQLTPVLDMVPPQRNDADASPMTSGAATTARQGIEHGGPGPVVRDGEAGPATLGVPMALGTSRTESWHRGWGLPRPTLYGLAAGSCLTFTVAGGTIAAEALAEVRAAGVGERRAEGFGQVEFDHPVLDGPQPGDAPDEPAVPNPGPEARPIAPGEQGHETARVYERAAWRAAIYRAAETISGDPACRRQVTPDGPSNSQLNNLRELAADLPSATIEARLAWLTRKKEGRPSWPESAVKTVTDLFTAPDRVWTLLDLPEGELVVTTDGRRALRDELRPEAIRVLLNACLREHARAEASARDEGGEHE